MPVEFISRGCLEGKLGESIIQMVRDLSIGNLGSDAKDSSE